MTKNQVNADIDRLHAMKLSIGRMTYGESSKGKYVLNDLTRKIADTTDFLKKMDLPSELNEARIQALGLIENSFAAIKQEYVVQKPDSKGHEFVSDTIHKRSDEIREGLGKFDAIVDRWTQKQ